MSHYTVDDRRNAREQRERNGIHGDFTDTRGRVHCGTCSGFISYSGATCTYCRNNPDKVRQITGDNWGQSSWSEPGCSAWDCMNSYCDGECEWDDEPAEPMTRAEAIATGCLMAILILFGGLILAMIFTPTEAEVKAQKAEQRADKKAEQAAERIVQSVRNDVVQSRGTNVLSGADSRTVARGLKIKTGSCKQVYTHTTVCNTSGTVTVSYVPR